MAVALPIMPMPAQAGEALPFLQQAALVVLAEVAVPQVAVALRVAAQLLVMVLAAAVQDFHPVAQVAVYLVQQPAAMAAQADSVLVAQVVVRLSFVVAQLAV